MRVNNTNYRNLPSAYQQVDYIESSGTQYINTQYTPNVNTEIDTDISWGTQSETWGVFFGVTSNDSSSDGIIGRIYNGSATTFNPRFCNGTFSERQITITTDVFHNIILKKNGGSIDGTAYTLTTSGTPYQSNIYIFCGNNGGSAWRYGKCRIREFKILESGTLVKDFIPCYRKSDSVIGLYDLVNDTFYTNAGSGTFTKGSDVLDIVEKQIYPATWNPGANTLLYLPLNGDVKDYSGHSYTITTNSTLQYFTDYVLSNGIDVNIGTLQGNFTIMGYFKATGSSTNNKAFNQDYIASGNYYGWYCDFNADGRNNIFRVSFLKQPAREIFKNYYSTTVTNWHHYCMVVSNDTNVKYYLDGTQIYNLSISGWSKPSTHLRIMGADNPTNMSSGNVATYGGRIIVENRTWTAQEISAYYN